MTGDYMVALEEGANFVELVQEFLEKGKIGERVMMV